jgi:hypothetical protein
MRKFLLIIPFFFCFRDLRAPFSALGPVKLSRLSRPLYGPGMSPCVSACQLLFGRLSGNRLASSGKNQKLKWKHFPTVQVQSIAMDIHELFSKDS